MQWCERRKRINQQHPKSVPSTLRMAFGPFAFGILFPGRPATVPFGVLFLLPNGNGRLQRLYTVGRGLQAARPMRWTDRNNDRRFFDRNETQSMVDCDIFHVRPPATNVHANLGHCLQRHRFVSLVLQRFDLQYRWWSIKWCRALGEEHARDR